MDIRRISKVTMLTALSFSILTAGCTYPYGKENYASLPMENLSLDLSKDEVRKVLGRGPSAVIGARREGEHVIEVWHYWKAYFNWMGGPDHIEEEYYLYFFDGVLVQWGRPGDWEEEADRIIEVRLR